MSKTVKWIIGIVIALVVLQFAMPFVWHLIYPTTSAYGYGMPMMRGQGFGSGYNHMPMMGFGFGGIFMWLLPLGLLILIGLGIVYLWKKINEKPAQQ